jgi:TorA maturation chaperone TorD
MPDPEQDRDAARADLCRLLAACYYEPGREFEEERVFAALRAAAARVDPGLAADARRLGDAFAAARLEDLLIDYTRLFLGPVAAPARPYGSVWLEADKGLMQDSTMAVLALYAEGGFEIAEAFRELPDHLAAELEFLYLLLFRCAQARLAGDDATLAAAADLRKRFLEAHLAAWVGPFTAAVAANAQTDFYRALAQLTERFIGTESRA